ncbi:MAG: grasp-with-spasm system SPASM domain peptide maturase [Prevotellaceae bacterium]|jgi:SPASM domain peptide maturase of grasp-with-spasm system|nr:grasp-with-spasm system SPASM domain peptide maturase [Prevotellaceae bacterium]
MAKNVFKLFSDCIPVKGFMQSIIYDLGRNKYTIIPNDLHEILTKFDGQTLSSIKDYYTGNDLVINEYFNFLYEQEYIFWCNKKDIVNFPLLVFEWDYPGYISNAIIILYNNSNFNFKTIISELSYLGCRNIIIHIKDNIEMDYVNVMLEIFKKYPYKHIDIFIPYSSASNDISILENICLYNTTINTIIIYNTPFEKKIQSDKLSWNIIFTKTKKIDYNFISKNKFSTNINTFSEAQNYNLFFNRKLIISSLGYILNSINTDDNKYNIYNKTLKDIIKEDGIRNKWNINKDRLLICKDCEFRYMCIDSRDPIEIGNNQWKFNTECNYNPYIAKWKDECGYITVEEWLKNNK